MPSQNYNRSSLVIVAVVLLAVVSLSAVLFKGWRIDLTENDLYTLSDGTKNVIEKIEEPVQLYFFYNREAAQGVPQLQTYATRVQEFLEELSLRGGDKLKLNLIAPEPFSTEEDRAVELGIQAVPLNDAGDNLYFGLAGTNAVDDTETIGFFQPSRENLLEYDVAKLIYSLANPDKPKVGLISTLEVSGSFNPQTMQPTQGWASITQLQEFFEVQTLQTDVSEIADDIRLLLLIHPVKLSDATLYAIDQFVLGGGRVLVFSDPYAETAAPRPGMSPMDDGPGAYSDLEPLFAAWGIKQRSEVLGDAAAALQVQSRQSQRPTYHLGMLGLDADHLSGDDVITQNLDSLNLGYAGSFEHLDDARTSFTPLIQSSDRAGLIPSFKIQPGMNPGNLQNGFAPTGDTYAIAARLRGPAASAYGEAPPDGISNPDHKSTSDEDINVIVVADTDMLSNRFWVQVQNFLGQQIATPFAGNGDFLVNAVDNLLGSSDVIGIKSQAGYTRPFTLVEDMKREADARFREHEQALQSKLRETESKLAELQSAKSEGNVLMLSPEQQAELEKFQEEQLRTRKELREVRHSLNKDIERLEGLVKFLNIGLMPILITLLAIGVSWRRRQHTGARV